jgi:hypothetical protein
MSKTSARLALLLLAGLTVGLLKAASAGEAEEGFTTIFNGKDLTGWDGDPSKTASFAAKQLRRTRRAGIHL